MKFKRKKLNLSVKRQFQIWLLVRILGTIILSSLVAAAILYFYSRQEIAATFYDAHIKIRRVSDLLLPVVAAGALVSLLSGMALALFLPQKIAGPLFRVENGLREMGGGDLTVSIKLRHGDTLMDLADRLNETASSLRDRVQAVQAAHVELEKVLAAVRNEETDKAFARQTAALGLFKI
ncbi:MAG: methyl-accepting chemotaxis protein [Desulfobulbaceae bacterium]|nr:methyl-accepting chemotaxis protein [Desulfobulbaceae bacterium]